MMRPIPGFEGLYSATEDGRIFSHISGRYLSKTLANNGFNVCRLSVNGKGKTYSVHNLVAAAWIEGSGYVRHKNGVKNDDAVSNLEYTTNFSWYSTPNRRLRCSNGEIYDTVMAAVNATGVAYSTILLSTLGRGRCPLKFEFI